MKSHKRKMVAPIIVTIVIILYFVLYFGLLFFVVKDETLWAYILGIIPLLLSGVMLKVCIERIKEIKKGEEDDLSKY